MDKIIDLSGDDAREYFLKGSSYFKDNLPKYINFEPIIDAVKDILNNKNYRDYGKKPFDHADVNYQFVTNKDGRFAWRPYELMHPVIYVSLVNKICNHKNWKLITKRLKKLNGGVVECCSIPARSEGKQSDKSGQVKNWWVQIEQKSLEYSLIYSHLLHSDVTDCYGSIYTHSIPWALHGRKCAKNNKRDNSLIGNSIDDHIRDSRYGQTNGICQGSTLMDFMAEIVLGYVDDLVTRRLDGFTDFKILRYRDDYRIFANNDERAEQILKIISDELRSVDMSLGLAKTKLMTNVIEGSVKPDKLAGIELQYLGKTNAKTIQKQLLKLHSFGRRYPNSGALLRLLDEFYNKIIKNKKTLYDLDVLIAIATDIGFVSPRCFPQIAGILSHLISKYENHDKKREMLKLIKEKMKRIPYNGYLEIWLQRITLQESDDFIHDSEEAICKIVNQKKDIRLKENIQLWNNEWIKCDTLKDALDTLKIVDEGSLMSISEVMQPEEIQLFMEDFRYY